MQQETPLCECGCGQAVNWLKGKPHRFLAGHATRLRSQSGPDHHNWIDGRSPRYYRRLALTAHGVACQRCGAEGRTLTHHIDRNRHNADPSNLEQLCHACHMKEHHGKRVDWTCPVCAATLSLQPWEASIRHFCSRNCKEASRGANGRFS